MTYKNIVRQLKSYLTLCISHKDTKLAVKKHQGGWWGRSGSLIFSTNLGKMRDVNLTNYRYSNPRTFLHHMHIFLTIIMHLQQVK